VAEAEYGSAGVSGLLSAALGAGTMLGALLGFRWRPRHPLRTGFLWCLPWPLVGVAFAFGAPLLALVPLFVGAGVGLTLFEIWWDTALAERIAPHLLSRVTAYGWMGSLALLPLSFALAGPAGEAVGAATLLAVGGVLAALALVAGLAVRETWTMRTLERSPRSP
jgi:hypothetical protein